MLTCHLFDEIPKRARHLLGSSTLIQRISYESLNLSNHIHDQEASIPIYSQLAKRGLYHQALESFRRVNSSGLKLTKFTLCTLLNSCTKVLNYRLGSQIHARIIHIGYEENLFLNSALVDLYAKCSAMDDAQKVFDSMKDHDHVSWTSIVSGFAQNGYGREALELFRDMLGSDVSPNGFTFASVISGCTKLDTAALEQCALLHDHVIKRGLDSSSYVVSSLIDCYSKCGKVNQAILLFYGTVERDTVLFNSMIAAYSQNSLGEEALISFMEMRNNALCPTEYTLSIVLNTCGELTTLQQGMQIHCLTIKMSSERSVYVVCSLVDMYSKCGNVDEARHIFDLQVEKNDVLWTSMITGYAKSGRGVEGLELFERFVRVEGIKPCNICFTAVLTACNHAGLLDKATYYFDKMRREYGLIPEIDQYACMVDLYGRTGHLKKAKKLLEEMPIEPNVVMWTSLLSSCSVHGEVVLGKEAADQLFKIDPNCAAHYVTLANIYAKAGLWGDVSQVRKLMREKGFRKSTGWSWIEVEKIVNVFSVSDTSHHRSQDIYAELDKLTLQMMEAGYMMSIYDEENMVRNNLRNK